MKKLIVFTDLDGTLLDHNNYRWIDAAPAIKALQTRNFPLIFNSSKTYYEIKSLSEEMNSYYPMISENGSVVALNIECNDTSENCLECYRLHYFAKPYADVIEVLSKIKQQHQLKFTGFSDMSTDDVMQYTGLSKHKAIAAAKREATEPLLWNDSDINLVLFENELKKNSLILTKGGRFYHVMSPVDKGEAIHWLLDCYQKREPETQWLTVGLGDSFNDIRMLESVDYPVLVKNPHSQQPDVSHINNIRLTDYAGPAGWNLAVQDILAEMS